MRETTLEECWRSLTACTAGAVSIRLARDRPVVAGHPPFSKPHSGGGLGYGRPAYSPHRQFPPVSGTSKTVGIRSCRALSPAVQRVRAGLQPLRAPFHRGSAKRRAITPPRLPSETPSGRGAMGAFGGGALALLACMLQGSSWMLFFAVPSEGVGVPAVPPGFVTLDYPPSDFQRPEVPPPPRPPAPPPTTRAHLTRACVFARAARSTCPATPSPASSASP